MRHLIARRVALTALIPLSVTGSDAGAQPASATPLPVSSGRLQVDIVPSMQRTLRRAGVTVFQTGRTSTRGTTSFPFILGHGALLDPLRSAGGVLPLRNGFSFARGGTAGVRFGELTVRLDATRGAVSATASSGRRYGIATTPFTVRRTARQATRRVPWYFEEDGLALQLTAPAARLLNRGLGRTAFRAGTPFASASVRAGFSELDVTSAAVRVTFSDTLGANGIVAGPVAPASAEGGTVQLPAGTQARMNIQQFGGRTIGPAAPVRATLGDLATAGGIAFATTGRSLTVTDIRLSPDRGLQGTTNDPDVPGIEAAVDTVAATPTGERAYSWRAAPIRLTSESARALDTLAGLPQLIRPGISPFAAPGGFATADIDVVVR